MYEVECFAEEKEEEVVSGYEERVGDILDQTLAIELGPFVDVLRPQLGDQISQTPRLLSLPHVLRYVEHNTLNDQDEVDPLIVL